MSKPTPRPDSYLITKRMLDVVLAIIVLIATSPLLVLIALIVRATMGAPVLFRQTRPGLNGKIFAMYKFRTMHDYRDKDNELLPDTQRLLPFGRFLRKSSLDELPGLLNVLRGEMSLVGPRPLRVAYLDHYSPEQARRHDVKPGITGWAQVNGRNALSWEERFKLDVWYVDNRSLSLDLRILWLIFIKIDPEIRFAAIGTGKDEANVRALATRLGVLEKNFFILDGVPKESVPSWLSAADMATSLLIDNEDLWHSSPNKFFDALAAGRPVAINYQGWLADLVHEYKAGIVLDPKDSGAAAKLIVDRLHNKDWLDAAGTAARRLARAHFSRNDLADKLITVLETVLESATRIEKEAAEVGDPSG